MDESLPCALRMNDGIHSTRQGETVGATKVHARATKPNVEATEGHARIPQCQGGPSSHTG